MWSPDQYARFARERRQPFDDLLALLERRPRMRVADLGCGTGELTRELHDQLGAADTIGIDSSAAMLARAARYAAPSLRFAQAAIEAFDGGPYDLVLSNAALHWVEDHASVFARLASLLAPGGQLAVQMPANDDHASHRLAAELAVRFGAEPRPSPLLTPAAYASLLHELGFTRQHVRLQVYGHLLSSVHDVVEWNRGALLTHYERQMTPDAFASFLDHYRERLVAVLGEQRPFFYTYDRILIWGERASG